MEGNAPADNRPDSPIRFNCNSCGQRIRVSQGLAGKRGRCPKCRNVVIIPQAMPTLDDDEPIRLKRDSDLVDQPARAIHTQGQESHRTGPDPAAGTTSDAGPQAATETIAARLIHMLTFPFSISGIIHFLAFWLLPVSLSLPPMIYSRICCLAPLLAPPAYLLLLCYYYYYIGKCVVASAQGKRFAPPVLVEELPGIGDFFRRGFLFVVCAIVCFAPAYVYLFIVSLPYIEGGLPVRYLYAAVLLYGIGVFFFPMFLLAAGMFDSIAALNPFLLTGSIFSVLLPYCGLVVLFSPVAAQFWPFGPQMWLVPLLSFTRPVLLLLVCCVDVYLTFIATYLLGRFYRRYEKRLNWEVKL